MVKMTKNEDELRRNISLTSTTTTATTNNNNNICINNGYNKHIYAYSKTSDEAACDDRSPLFLVEDNSGATAGVWGN